MKQSTDLHTDQLSQAALAEFIRRGHLTRHLAKMKKVHLSRLEAMEAALEKHMPERATWTRPEGGMSVWVTLPAGFDAGDLLIHARERGIYFVPGRHFYSQSPRAEYAASGIFQRGRKEYYARHRSFLRRGKEELRKRQRGVRDEAPARVALV